ncbi:MAG: DUF58 domain-containing protein [Bacteroidales bacterium]|nr:DUF58 domain-containing protein [Bacteroidales bacterium]
MSGESENFSRYSSIEFKTNKIVEGFITGLHKSPFHGFSVEFAEHRLYNSGESTRHIDWKLYARTDKIFVKKYEEETNLRCLLVLDTSSSMYFPFGKYVSMENPNKLSFSIYAAGCLFHLLYKQRDAFGLAQINERIDSMSEIKTNFAHKQRIFTLLEQFLQSKETKNTLTNIDKPLHEIAERIHKRSLIIIFTDLFSTLSSDQELIKALQHLRYNKHEIILFYVYDKEKEVELDFKERPYRFVDAESGEEVKITPSQLKDRYSEEVKEKIANIKAQCNNLQIDFVQADINKGFDQIMLPFLIKRSRLK